MLIHHVADRVNAATRMIAILSEVKGNPKLVEVELDMLRSVAYSISPPPIPERKPADVHVIEGGKAKY